MKSKTFILALIFIATAQLKAQEEAKVSKFDYRFGLGVSLLGTGDIFTISIENELNYKLNRYFTSAVSLNNGKSATTSQGSGSFIQGNIIMFLSPFNNTRKNDFRFGLGVSYAGLTSISATEPVYNEYGGLKSSGYSYVSNADGGGANLILEDSFYVSDRFLIGFKTSMLVLANDTAQSMNAFVKVGMRL